MLLKDRTDEWLFEEYDLTMKSDDRPYNRHELKAEMLRRMGAPKATAPVRKKLPDERRALTHAFDVGGHGGYLTVGLYEDGKPGEIFLTMAKEGSTISGLMDAFAVSVSLNLQYGVPLEVLVEKFSHTRFEPSGYTKNAEIPIAKSIVDYVFRYLASRFLTETQRKEVGVVPPAKA